MDGPVARVQRRRLPRWPTDLFVEYRFQSDAPWRNGRLADLSEHGAAVELHDLAPGESFGDRIDLEICSQPQDPIGLVLRGRIRHRSRQPDGLVIGVEFTPNGTNCIDLLRVLSGLRPTRSDVQISAHDSGFALETLAVDDLEVWAWRQGTDFVGPAFLGPQAALTWMERRLHSGSAFDQLPGAP
jgi:hypothetical protein